MTITSRYGNCNAHAKFPTTYRNLLRTYKERIEALNSIINELKAHNETLKQKVTYYHNALVSSDVPHLHARIKQLMAEIVKLKNK